MQEQEPRRLLRSRITAIRERVRPIITHPTTNIAFASSLSTLGTILAVNYHRPEAYVLNGLSIVLLLYETAARPIIEFESNYRHEKVLLNPPQTQDLD